MSSSLIDLSRLLSRALRHDPAALGIELDPQGWTDCAGLIEAVNRRGRGRGMRLDRDLLDTIVRTSDKQRFALSADGTRIRANQGHSVPVDLALPLATPPEILYHGTVAKSLPAIRTEGLRRGSRHHVHLSPDLQTATKVGQRRGKPVILTIHATAMAAAGHAFHCSENGVWLTDAVPAGFIGFGD